MNQLVLTERVGSVAILTLNRAERHNSSVAQDIAAKKRGSIVQMKRLLGLTYGDLAALLEAERLRFVEQIGSEEARQGIHAFLEARSR